MGQVKSLAEASDWVKRCPNPFPIDSPIEIRQVFESPELTDNPDLLTKKAGRRAKSAKNAGR